MATWKNDPDHSHLGFVVRHLMITDINGRFADVAIDLETAKVDLSDAVFTMTVKAVSIDTHVHARDEHLRRIVPEPSLVCLKCAAPRGK